jgi:uncharacterized protein DUF4136
MNKARMLWAVTVLVLLASCGGMKVRSGFDPTADFARLRTYDWEPALDRSATSVPAGTHEEQAALARLRWAVASELAVKGIRRPLESGPDFWVRCDFTQQRRDWSPPAEAYVNSDRDFGDLDSPNIVTLSYVKGTVTLVFVDPSTRRTLWWGKAACRTENGDTPEERGERIVAAVQAILTEYPPNP